jgi:hypothetical protein
MLRPLSHYQKAKSNVQEFKSNKVPDAIINWVGPGEKKRAAQTSSRSPQKSNFLLTLVTNLGYKRFDTPGRIKLAEHLNDVMEKFGEGLRSGEFFKCANIRGKSYSCEGVGVEEYEFTLEIGDKKGNVHSHCKLICDGVVHIDTAKCNAFATDAFKEYHEAGGKPYFNVRSFPNTEAIIDAYLQKSQNSLTTQQFAEVK